MGAPTLHEIAAMPFPASVEAMRKHYNPEWGKPIPDGAVKRVFTVDVDFTYEVHDSRIVQVEAFSEEEAEEKASDELSTLLAAECDGLFDVDVFSARVCESRQ